LSALTAEALREVSEAVRKELGIEEALPWDKVYLLTSGISLTEHEKYATGELAAFLDRFRPGGRFAVQPLFRTLCGELARRATHEWHPVSFEELCQRKGIRRADLEDILQVAVSQPNQGEGLEAVKAQLRQEGTTYREIGEIEAAWLRYDIDRINDAAVTVQAFKKQVMSVVEEVVGSKRWQTLREFVAEAEADFLRRHGSLDSPFDVKYLRGAILYELKAHEARQLPSADSQPARETT
jgi:hypothetical protein